MTTPVADFARAAGFEFGDPLAENTPVVILTPETGGEPVNLFNVTNFGWDDGDQGFAALKTETDPVTQILGRDASTLSFSGQVYTEALDFFIPGTDQLYHKQDAFAMLRRYKRSKEPLGLKLIEGPHLGSFWCTSINLTGEDLVLGMPQTVKYTARFKEVSLVGNTYTPPPVVYRPNPEDQFALPTSIGPDVSSSSQQYVYGEVVDANGNTYPGVFTPLEPESNIKDIAGQLVLQLVESGQFTPSAQEPTKNELIDQLLRQLGYRTKEQLIDFSIRDTGP